MEMGMHPIITPQTGGNLDEVDAVLAVMIMEEQARRPFNAIEQITVEAIAELAVSSGRFPVAVARSLMGRFRAARLQIEENQQ